MGTQRRTLAPMAAWSVVSWAVAAVYLFLTSSLVIRATGDSGYGLWSTVGALRGFVLFLDGGLAFGVSRDAALTEGRDAADARIRAAWRIYAILALVAVLLTVLAVGLPEALLDLSGERAEAARGVTIAIGADAALSLLGSPMLAILRGRQRMGTIAALNAAQAVAGLALLSVLLPRWGVAGAAVAVLGARAVFAASAWVALRRAGFMPGRTAPVRLADAARFAAPLWIISFGTLLGMGIDTLVVGACYGAETAGRYAQGTALPVMASGILFAITGASFPRMVSAGTGEPARWIGAQFFLATFLAAAGFGFIATHEDALLTLWVGRAAPIAVTVAMISCLSWTLNAPTNVLSNLAIARGVHGALGPIVAAEALLNLGLTVGLATSWSPAGPAVATLATILLSNVVVVPAVLRPRLGLTWTAIAKPSLLGWGLGFACAVVVRIGTLALDGSPLVTFASGAAATVAAAGLVLETTVRSRSAILEFTRDTWRGARAVRSRQRAEAGSERARLERVRRESPFVWVKERPPLVTVTIPTYRRGRLIADRAIASALSQTHANLEVVVVGDRCDEETAAAVLSVRDPRVRFENLAERGRYPANPMLRWMVAGTAPRNRALDMARGEWIAPLDDDDEFTPDHVEALLDACRSKDLEFAYGIAEMEEADGTWSRRGAWPLAQGDVIHAAVLYSARLGGFRYDIDAWRVDQPGDWNMWSRFRDAGARMGFVDRVVCRHYAEKRGLVEPAPFWAGQ